jgi:hypothetical protein
VEKYFQGLSKDNMTKREEEEIEKLYLYCLGELRMLIENPYAYNDLLERLSSVKNSVERLYEKTVLKEK